jgi:hypothetical protein
MTEMYFKERDIEPIIYEDGNIFIDINTDGYIDFEIFQIDWLDERGDTTGKMILIFPFIYGRISLEPIEENTYIDNSITFFEGHENIAVQYYNNGNYDDFWQGNFVSDTGLYMPIKYVFRTDEYFGWIQISVDEITGEVKIWDLALQDTAGKSIKAGEKP